MTIKSSWKMRMTTAESTLATSSNIGWNTKANPANIIQNHILHIKYWLKYKCKLRQYHTTRLAEEFLKSQRRVKQLPLSFLSRLFFCKIFGHENYCWKLWWWWWFIRILVRSHIKRKSSQERCLLNYNHWHCNNHWSLGIW